MQVTIFYNKEKTAFQIVRPSSQFAGDYRGLVNAITGGNHHSYDIN